MSLAWRALRTLLFQFEPESAHALALLGARALGKVPGALAVVSGAMRLPGPSWRLSAWEMSFLSRVGLAAGFDKNAEWLPLLPQLGFGFVEIGTVTPKPQGGNPQPRLFRDPARRALFNCMGFNNLGAAVVSERVLRARDRGMPGDFRIGINVGKNRDTSVQDAARDYAAALAPFAGAVDFAVVNVSSPNTPGLRALQAREALAPIVAAVVEESARWNRAVPVAVKLAPEFAASLPAEELPEFFAALEKEGVRGWVLSNTLAAERTEQGKVLRGGESGGPLTERARELVRRARVQNWTGAPLISVGGIFDEAEAQERMSAGADLVELYTGWIYGGPRLPSRLGRALAAT